MNKWINVKDALPLDGTIVKIKMCILFWTEKEVIFVRKYFVHQGENITRWVTEWMPLPELPKET